MVFLFQNNPFYRLKLFIVNSLKLYRINFGHEQNVLKLKKHPEECFLQFITNYFFNNEKQ
jgi:hypothetical protein